MEEASLIDIPIEGGKGLAQGGANVLNGLQDSVIGIGNLVIGIPNVTASGIYWLRGTEECQQIKIPYIPSPDWSRDLIVVESDLDHSISKIAGAGGVELLTGTWIAKAAKARAAKEAVEEAGEGIARWLDDFDVVRCDDDGFVAVSRDGKRRFRMDFEGHGDVPHAHFERFTGRRWRDAGPQHRYPFKQSR